MKIACCSLSLLAVCLLPAAVPAEISVTKENAFKFYRGFHRLTAEPRQVLPEISILCTSPSPARIAQRRSEAGPHFEALIHLYANPPAHAAITRRLDLFPAGAVIVKEKLGDRGKVTAVGGMIKRPTGYDAANGDWEYFYSDEVTGFSTGHLPNCAACHTGPKTVDHLFTVRSF